MIDYERRGSGDPRRFRLSINPEILRDGMEDPLFAAVQVRHTDSEGA